MHSTTSKSFHKIIKNKILTQKLIHQIMLISLTNKMFKRINSNSSKIAHHTKKLLSFQRNKRNIFHSKCDLQQQQQHFFIKRKYTNVFIT